jgi:hypothetical protein
MSFLVFTRMDGTWITRKEPDATPARYGNRGGLKPIKNLTAESAECAEKRKRNNAGVSALSTVKKIFP